MDEAGKLTVLRITGEGQSDAEELVVSEFALTISFNNQELVTLLCSPAKLRQLAVGFLYSEGLIKGKEDIKKVVSDDQRGLAWVETHDGRAVDPELSSKRLITSGCGKGPSFQSVADLQGMRVESGLTVSPGEVSALVHRFQHYSDLHKTTHGVHSAALCDAGSILVFSDDIGRHNAIDKVLGECLLSAIPTHDRLMVISGRVSSEMLLKVARKGIAVLVSISAPTDLGVKLADDLGMTLIGLVRGKRMNVYSGRWRIKDQ
jgi:FdhD protein